MLSPADAQLEVGTNRLLCLRGNILLRWLQDELRIQNTQCDNCLIGCMVASQARPQADRDMHSCGLLATAVLQRRVTPHMLWRACLALKHLLLCTRVY